MRQLIGPPAARGASAAALALLLAGCGEYVTPGRAADMRAFGATEATVEQLTDPRVAVELDRRPLAAFPTAIAVVRVQAPRYRSHTTSGYGTGAYSVVTHRDVEAEDVLEQLESLSMVRGIAPLNRLVIPATLQSDRELRAAAARVHADMVFIYTLDTEFDVHDPVPALSVLSLGLLPDDTARVSCTASGILLDTRSGYVYALNESSARQQQLANAWTSADAVDQVRRRVEAEAFRDLVEAFTSTWPGVVETYAPGAAATAGAGQG